MAWCSLQRKGRIPLRYTCPVYANEDVDYVKVGLREEHILDLVEGRVVEDFGANVDVNFESDVFSVVNGFKDLRDGFFLELHLFHELGEGVDFGLPLGHTTGCSHFLLVTGLGQPVFELESIAVDSGLVVGADSTVFSQGYFPGEAGFLSVEYYGGDVCVVGAVGDKAGLFVVFGQVKVEVGIVGFGFAHGVGSFVWEIWLLGYSFIREKFTFASGLSEIIMSLEICCKHTRLRKRVLDWLSPVLWS